MTRQIQVIGTDLASRLLVFHQVIQDGKTVNKLLLKLQADKQGINKIYVCYIVAISTLLLIDCNSEQGKYIFSELVLKYVEKGSISL
jgi:hypothetical protein